MGNTTNLPQIQQISCNQEQIHQQIIECIKLKRLHFSHQSNIFVKFQYLVKHFQQFEIEQILLGIVFNNYFQVYIYDQKDHNMIRNELIQLITKINLKFAKQKLKVICLSFNEIVCQSLKSIVNFDLINLTTLHLDYNIIGNDGCYYLTKPKLQSLQTLDLTSNKIQEEGSRFLAMGNWPQLRTLLISQNKLSVRGFLYLSKGQWPNLIFIQAKKNDFQISKKLQLTKFRTEVKGFRIQLQ